MRRAAKVDANQAEIVRDLRRANVSVEVIGKPLDLLINARFFCPHCSHEIPQGRTSLMDCKSIRPTSEGGGHGLTKDQIKFIARWPGKVDIAKSIDQALEAVLGKDAMR